MTMKMIMSLLTIAMAKVTTTTMMVTHSWITAWNVFLEEPDNDRDNHDKSNDTDNDRNSYVMVMW